MGREYNSAFYIASMPRSIAVVTTSRADYSHLYWVLRELESRPEIGLELIASGAHLSPRFGMTVEQIEADGFACRRVPCLVDRDDDVAMAETIGRATSALAPLLGELRPDLLLVIADRYEMLAPAAVATALRIPIAHIEGGDVSEGAIDDAVRNALTKLAHLHFAPTELSARRLVAMGEEPWRVTRSGAPSLDHLVKSEIPEVDVPAGTIVVAYHPVTIARDTLREVEAFYEALERTKRPVAFCFPNADAGSHRLIERATAFCASRPDATLHVNLEATRYWGLLRASSLMLGNSSSGIMETPSLELPTVNVGLRQHGRERARNVVDAEPNCEAILQAIEKASDPAFRAGLAGMTNPYGDGRAAERIADRLVEAPLGEGLLRKTPPEPAGS